MVKRHKTKNSKKNFIHNSTKFNIDKEKYNKLLVNLGLLVVLLIVLRFPLTWWNHSLIKPLSYIVDIPLVLYLFYIGFVVFKQRLIIPKPEVGAVLGGLTVIVYRRFPEYAIIPLGLLIYLTSLDLKDIKKKKKYIIITGLCTFILGIFAYFYLFKL